MFPSRLNHLLIIQVLVICTWVQREALKMVKMNSLYILRVGVPGLILASMLIATNAC